MSKSTGALAARGCSKSSRKVIPQHFLGSAAVAGLVLGCAWTVYSNIFGASVYPSVNSAAFEAPVIKQAVTVAARRTRSFNEVFASLPEPAPKISPADSTPSVIMFNERFASSAPQSEPSRVIDEPKLALASAPNDPPKVVEAPRKVEGPKLAEAPKTKPATAPLQVAALSVPPPAEAKPVKNSVRDMAQRAKAAVMSIASNEKQTIVDKLWGTPKAVEQRPSLLSFASADANVTGSIGPVPSLAAQGTVPRYERDTAVYDITARMVYLPDGSKLEAHSGLRDKLDDPRYAHVRMQGVTPPHLYDLTPRESLFHGVAALRLNPVGGEDKIFGRSGLLAHTYMLGPNGDSNGCVSFRDYNAFLHAYRNQGIKRLAVVARID